MASSSSSSSAGPGHSDILYTAIAKGKTILASHSNGTQNASSIATLILSRIDLQVASKQTFVHQQYQIHYIHTAPTALIKEGLTFLAIGTEELGRRVPFATLFKLQREFAESHPDETLADVTGTGELQSEMGPVLAHLAASANHVDAGRAREVQREIDGVKDIMSQNIERVLERGERIDLLVDKSAQLGSSSLAFKRRSQAVKRQMWWQKTRTTALIGVVILFLIYLMVGIGCGLPLWNRCF